MTIKCSGHVEKLEIGSNGGFKITFRLAIRRSLEVVVIETEKGEADMYKPGMGVEVTIIPQVPHA